MNLRDIVDAATPGPWSEMVLGSEGYVVHAEPPEGQRRRPSVARCVYEAWDVDKANAQFIATFDPQLVGRLLDIVNAARHFVDQRGWAPLVGRPGRCIDCHASVDWDLEHGDHCSYDAMRHSIVALLDALGATEVTA